MKTIKYPTNRDFSLKSLLSTQNIIRDPKKKLTKVGLFLKVKREIAKGNIEVVGAKKHKGRGRPQSLYRVKQAQPVEVQELIAA